MAWISVGLRMLPMIVTAVEAVEKFVSAIKDKKPSQEKEDAAVNMVAGVLQAVVVV